MNIEIKELEIGNNDGGTAEILHSNKDSLRINLLVQEEMFTRIEIQSEEDRFVIKVWDPSDWFTPSPAHTITYPWWEETE